MDQAYCQTLAQQYRDELFEQVIPFWERHSVDEARGGYFSCLDRQVHDYTWTHFRDGDDGGEWFGYLNRRGELLLDLKGGKWKGCFHVPRALQLCYRQWQAVAEQMPDDDGTES